MHNTTNFLINQQLIIMNNTTIFFKYYFDQVRCYIKLHNTTGTSQYKRKTQQQYNYLYSLLLNITMLNQYYLILQKQKQHNHDTIFFVHSKLHKRNVLLLNATSVNTASILLNTSQILHQSSVNLQVHMCMHPKMYICIACMQGYYTYTYRKCICVYIFTPMYICQYVFVLYVCVCI